MTRPPPQELDFLSWDGTRLFYRAWLPAAPAARALLLIHRGHEHSGRWQEVVDRLGLDDTAIFAWDQRGHGRSPGERGWAPDFHALAKDLEAFARHVAATHGVPLERTALLAHSVGAVLAAAWVHDYAPPIRAMVLATPAFRVKLYVPFALPLLRLKQSFVARSFVKSYVKSSMLTHDPEQARLYAADPLISRNIAVNLLIDLFDVSSRLLDDAGALRVPTLVLSAGSDWVVRNGPQRLFFERLSSPVKEHVVLPGFHHAIFHERDRDLPIARAREFLKRAFEGADPDPSPLLAADQAGFTKEEYDRLSAPRCPFSPRQAGFALQRASMKTLGRLSAGIRLGWRTGFDSGQTLDYIYENRARGWSPLGRWVDRAYLDTVGWRGIRRRKEHLRAILARALEGRPSPVRIVDIAAGAGRYLLETLGDMPAGRASALLRDRSPGALEEGRTLARSLGLANAEFAEGDAFDRASLSALSPKPDLAVVSGLYELFPDNARIRASLAGLHDALVPGGLLIYTNQPWHPQVEMIARVLINRDGKPWIMRRRTQAEMDALVREAGFEKLAQEIDEWGIFTVSLARKRPA